MAGRDAEHRSSDSGFLARPLPPVHGELRIQNDSMRELVQPHARVEYWIGSRFVGEMSGRSLTWLVEHHFASAALTAAIQAELARPEPPRFPPARVIVTDEKAALRARRREARKRRAKSE